jgi:hypothetical protein
LFQLPDFGKPDHVIELGEGNHPGEQGGGRPIRPDFGRQFSDGGGGHAGSKSGKFNGTG